jgi:hypothetical protein
LELIVIKVAIGMPTNDDDKCWYVLHNATCEKKRGHAQLQKYGEEIAITIPAQP